MHTVEQLSLTGEDSVLLPSDSTSSSVSIDAGVNGDLLLINKQSFKSIEL